MDAFGVAFDFVLAREGVYDDRPDDPGGETCFGVARSFHPAWRGWLRVDALKRTSPERSALAAALRKDELLGRMVESFYFSTFWSGMGCSLLPDVLSLAAFDAVVNMGGTGAVILQESLNGVGRFSLKADGSIGVMTAAAARTVVERDELLPLLTEFHLRRMYHYGSRRHGLANIRGWTGRVKALDLKCRELLP